MSRKPALIYVPGDPTSCLPVRRRHRLFLGDGQEVTAEDVRVEMVQGEGDPADLKHIGLLERPRTRLIRVELVLPAERFATMLKRPRRS